VIVKTVRITGMESNQDCAVECSKISWSNVTAESFSSVLHKENNGMPNAWLLKNS